MSTLFIKIPDSRKIKKVHHQLRAPFVIYADFESYIQTNEQNEDIHVPASFAYYVVADHKDYINKGVVTYSGDNVVHTFLKCMMEEEDRMEELVKKELPPPKLTP